MRTSEDTFPHTVEGMKEDIRLYFRRYTTMHSDDLLHDIKESWPTFFEAFIKQALTELEQEGFLRIEPSGERLRFTATLANPREGLQ